MPCICKEAINNIPDHACILFCLKKNTTMSVLKFSQNKRKNHCGKGLLSAK
jgi:predicted PolB exonuclease-like 3'-5' exonuclease